MMVAEPTGVVLPPVIDLDALDGVRDRLLEAIDRGAVDVDAAGVERVATNALLMLLSAAQTAAGVGCAFRIGGTSPAFAAAVQRLGLDVQFAALRAEPG